MKLLLINVAGCVELDICLYLYDSILKIVHYHFAEASIVDWIHRSESMDNEN